MFPFPGPMPPPMGPMGPLPMMGGPMAFIPPTNMHGKTRYKYVTEANDGLPPMEGAVPAPTQAQAPFGPSPPPCPFGAPMPPPFPCWGPPPPYGLAPPAPPPVPSAAALIPKPPPPPSQAFSNGGDPAHPPMSGNRVNGQLARFPDKSGYIFPKHSITIHLCNTNVVHEYKDQIQNGRLPLRQFPFTEQRAPCDMTVAELIEQIDCKKRANKHPPYNQPGSGYPEHAIGIQEIVRDEPDPSNPHAARQFYLGSKIMLNTPMANQKLGEIWGTHRGSAGGGEPVWLVRWPC